VSDVPQGDGWWIASDGKWYPPHLHPDARSDAEPVEEPPPGWWLASDGKWYPPDQHPALADEPPALRPTVPGVVGRGGKPPVRGPIPVGELDDEMKRFLAGDDTVVGAPLSSGGQIPPTGIRHESEPGAWRGTVGAPPPGFTPPGYGLPGASEPEEFFATSRHASRHGHAPGERRSGGDGASAGSGEPPKRRFGLLKGKRPRS